MGDGRAVLRSSIREFLASEAMHGLGIPTTRALAVTGSDYPVVRETVETAAVVTRLAPSFVRFGSFEYFYWTEQHDALKQLADFIIDRFYPEARATAQPYLAFLEQVARRTARLVAQWQGVGFCHGVLNTDNMSILGLTIDYGPYGFIDGFDAGHVCNHSDEHGRYAFNMQPQIGHWNLYALGQALVPLTDDVDATKAAIDTYLDEYSQAIDEVYRAKLGLTTMQPEDEALINGLIELLNANHTDWTLFWRRLATLRTDAPCRRPRRRSARPRRRPRGLRRLGDVLSRPTCPGGQRGRRTRRAHEPREPEVHPAQPPCRDGHPQGARRRGSARLQRDRAPAGDPLASVRRATRARGVRRRAAGVVAVAAPVVFILRRA